MSWGISHEHRFVFVHIPKTAGTSICSSWDGALFKRTCKDHGVLGGLHKTAEQISDEYPHEWKHYLRFTVVRNPYDRFVSGAFFRALERVDLDWDKIPRPQTEYLRIRGEMSIDRILRFETLKSDLRMLCEEVGFEFVDLPHFRSTDKGRWQEYLTDTDIEKINAIYGDDFDELGYDRGP